MSLWPWSWRDEVLARLDAIDTKLRSLMSGLTNLQAADAALQAEVVTILQDIVTALANADNDAAVQAVADDITNNIIPKLQAGDPLTPPAPTPPAGP